MWLNKLLHTYFVCQDGHDWLSTAPGTLEEVEQYNYYNSAIQFGMPGKVILVKIFI